MTAKQPDALESAPQPGAGPAQPAAPGSAQPAAGVQTRPAHRGSELRKRGEDRSLAEDAALSLADAQRHLQELKLLQVELEMQNDELRRAQEELEETRVRYVDLFEFAPVGYLTLAENGGIVEANLTAAALLGVTRGSLVLQPLTRFMDPEHADRFHQLRRLVAEAGPQECEVRMSGTRNGGEFWCHLHCAASRTGGYRVTLSDSSDLRRHRDQLHTLVQERTAELETHNRLLEGEIAERQRAEDALSQSQQRYRAVVEDQTDLITRHRPDGRYLFVNGAFCRFFGKTQQEAIGRSWQEDCFPEDIPLMEKRLNSLSPENPVLTVEIRVISGSGEVRWMQLVTRGIFTVSGELRETQAVARDITERKQAEEMLLVYAGEVQDLYNHAPCGYHSLDREGLVIRMNDTELSWLGYQRHEVVGVKKITDLLGPEGQQMFRTHFPRFLEQGRVSDLEFPMVRKDGSWFPVIVNAEVIRDADGSYLMSRSTVFDNTERRKAEEARRRSEEKFRGIFENAPIGIFQAALDGRFISVNPTMAAMFGYREPRQMVELTSQGVLALFVHQEQREGIVQRALATGGYAQEEVAYRRRDGSAFVAQLNVRVVQTGGEMILEGFVEDVTSRREAEQALQKSEQQFRQMAETVGEVFWLTASSHEALYISPAFERIWGRPCAELYANPRIWMDAIIPEDLAQTVRDLQLMEQGMAVQMEYRIRRPDGALRWISDRGYPVRDASGGVSFISGVASDITERKQAEDALRKYARRLIVLEEDLRKRIAMELHDDIGQVLTALGLNLAHIGNRLQQQAADELQSVFEDSRNLTKEISRSVRNLMVDLRPTQLDEYGLAAAIRSHAEQFAQRTGIGVEVEADPRLPRLAAKKEIALFRITQEALNNASKHAAAGRITVDLLYLEGVVRLEICDDGEGFLPQPAPQPTGSGWGLTIMRERAELAGGRFRVESTPGRGTTVTVELKGGR